jgi:lysophospholipase L1-like esterase
MHTPPRRLGTIGSAVTALSALLVLTAGCSAGGGGSSADAGPRPTSSASTSPAPTASADASTYVALGDSYTAGPGIAPEQANAGLCGRSSGNWPTRLATSLDLGLTDLSCSGATTADLSATLGSGTVPADAGLVTVSAGGNDGGLFLSLIRACTVSAQQCRSYVDDEAPAILERTTGDLVALLEKTGSTAPGARVVLVGYPRIMPTSGTCQAVGIAAGDVTSVVTAETALDAALAGAAEQAGVDYVSLREPSEGHDACAGDQAWTNGVSPAAGDGIVFHPNARGMAAVADVVAAAVR